MSLLDSAVYNLSNPKDQQQAIQDIIDEQNNQFDESQSYAGMGVAAFGVSQVLLNLPPWADPPLVVKTHALGFAPIFLVYFGTLAAGGIQSAPLIEYNSTFNAYPGVVNFFVDSTNLYVDWKDHAQAQGQSFTYIIFDRAIT